MKKIEDKTSEELKRDYLLLKYHSDIIVEIVNSYGKRYIDTKLVADNIKKELDMRAIKS